MASPKKTTFPGDEASARLVELYTEAEKTISARLTKVLAATDGEKNKLTIRALEQQHKAIKKALKSLLSKSKSPIKDMVNASFNGGIAVARKELKEAGITDIVLEMGGINAKFMDAYSEQIYNRMAEVVQSANRTTTDIYRALKLNTSMGGAVGGYDSIGNIRRNLQKLSDGQGITAFIDKRGRNWNMQNYCDMLCRTATTQIYHQAKNNEYAAHGEDLVIVTYHTPTCPKCAPWGGKVLSLTGETPGYPTIDEARAAGLFHPNCRHTYSLYMEFDDGTDNNPWKNEEKKPEPFTDEEERALRKYVSSDSYVLNEKLRGGGEYSQEDVDMINHLDSALGKIPDFAGTVFRNITFDMASNEEYEDFVQQHAVGQRVVYRAYTSTSKSREGYEIEGDKVVHLTVKVKRGKDISSMGYGVEGEEEILLPRLSRFEIIQFDGKGNELFIETEEL